MVVPGGALLVSLIIMWSSLGKFEEKRDLKIAASKEAQESKIQEKALESLLAPRRGQMEYWEGHLTKDTVESFNENLDMILKRYDSNQLRPPTARRPAGKGVLGRGVEANAALFQLTFEGGFGPMQELMAELEVRMPQLVLEGIKITPAAVQAGGLGQKLKFELTYMAWSK